MTTSTPTTQLQAVKDNGELAALEAKSISAWFGDRKVLDRVSLFMPAGSVTALIGPSGCGKSTFLRILNRMHELVPRASLAGEILLDGADIYRGNTEVTETRRRIGMVFQKPNPFPMMSVYENVAAGPRLRGWKMSRSEMNDLVERNLGRAALWDEVKDKLGRSGAALSGGQQQRLCIARALATDPAVLLMDEPASALDPIATYKIEELVRELAAEVTIVIVTHNMQQAARVSDRTGFFTAEVVDGQRRGRLVEYDRTEVIFTRPTDSRTEGYITGRFG